MGSFRDEKHTGNPGSLFLFLKPGWETGRIAGLKYFRCMFGWRDRSSLSLVRQGPVPHTHTIPPHPRAQPHSGYQALAHYMQCSTSAPGAPNPGPPWPPDWKHHLEEGLRKGKGPLRESMRQAHIVSLLSLDCMAESYQNGRGSSCTLVSSFPSFSYFLLLIFSSRNMGNLSLYGLFAKLMFCEVKERMGPALSSLTTCTEEKIYLTQDLEFTWNSVAQARFGEAFIVFPNWDEENLSGLDIGIISLGIQNAATV